MDEFERGKFGFIFFFLIIIALGVGGYFLINLEEKQENEKPKEEVKNISDALKIDKAKSYIYKEVDSVLNEDIPVIYDYPVINLNSIDAQNLNNTLKNAISNIKNNVKYQNEVELEEDEEVLYSEGNIYSADLREYEIYEYDKYVSLVIYDSTYFCTGKSDAKIMQSYTFDVETGKLLTTDEILFLYQVKSYDINSAIKTHLTRELNALIAEDETKVNFIEITNTLETLEVNKTLIYHINNKGDLIVTFVVKTESIDYNDNIIID